MKNLKGFTIVELMTGIAIVGLLIAIAIPSLSQWIIRMRVDSEISTIHRLVLTARNSAINLEQPVTICPLQNNACTNNWDQQISVFINIDNDATFDPLNEVLIRVKDPIHPEDTLVYPFARLNYIPTGGATSVGSFVYCPGSGQVTNRAVVIMPFGRSYVTSDTDDDNVDEDRLGNEVSC